MPLTAHIIGPGGNQIYVGGEGELTMAMHSHPPINEMVSSIPFRQYMTSNGLSSGTNSMAVNGSTTNVDYYVLASPDYDIYLNSISVEIADTGTPSLDLFGSLATLTNGVAFYWDTNENGQYELHEGIKTNLEFIRLGSKTSAIGDGTNAFLADISGGTSIKSYLPVIDFDDAYGLIWGVRLRKGTNDRIRFRVRDNLTGLSRFTAITYGFRI